MSQSLVRSRGRALALTTAVGLAFSTAAVVGSPTAHAAPPAEDCTAPFPVADLVPGDAVTGLTVSSGTTPTGFTGEVLGVLNDGFSLDVDAVIVKLSSPTIDDAGVWAGMSGSPVYASDGRLIGAVSFGATFGPSPVAGVTPFEDMDDYLAAAGRAPSKKLRVPASLARTIAAQTDLTTAQAAQGFSQLPMRTGVAGVGAKRLEKAATAKRPYVYKGAYATGAVSSAAAAPGPETLEAGGNVAATVSYGDITSGGVGTVTSVCNGKVVAFGHPFGLLGETSLTMHTADAITVWADPAGTAFKLANFGAPAGTITDDHFTGITGTLGAGPATSTVTSSVDYRGRSRTGSTNVSIPQAMAATTFYQLNANHDRVIDGWVKGSEAMTWAIAGTDERGARFHLSGGDRFTSSSDIGFESVFDLADLVYTLSSLPNVNVTSVTSGADVVDSTATWSISQIQQKRNGRWVKVGPTRPAKAKAGKKLTVRAVLTGASGTTTVPFSFNVPKKARGSVARVYLNGGNDLFTDFFSAESVADVSHALAKGVRNDQIQAELSTNGSSANSGFFEFFRRGCRPVAGRGCASDPGFGKTKVSAPLSQIVSGFKRVKVAIR